MTRIPFSLALLAVLAACDNAQPLIFPGDEIVEVDDAEEVTEDETSGSDPASSAVPPTIDEILDEGTLEVALSGARDARGDISRTEARDGSGGFAEDFIVNETADTLEIDNLAFDGLNIYTRGANTSPARISDLGTVAAYHGDLTVPDFLTGAPVEQAVPYVALYDESDVIIIDDIPADATPEEIAAIQAAARPRSSFTIVRTGAYVGFGFGGFGYDRAGDTVIATTGQATFDGDYGGLRVVDEFPELLVIEGDIQIDIDFDDFNSGAGLKGQITNRQAYTAEGELFPTFTGIDRRTIDPATLPVGVLASEVVQLPTLDFVVRGGGETIKSNGELSGEIRSRYVNPTSGATEVYEDGFYYALIAGDTTAGDGGEVTGVIKVESPDSRFIGVNAQETGGFVASRTQLP